MKTRGPSLFLSLFLISFAALNSLLDANDESWQLEIGGGASLFQCTDLARFQEAENHYLNLYFRNNPSYRVQEMVSFSSLKHLFSGQIRLRRRLNRRFALEIAFQAFDGQHKPYDQASFIVNEGWRTLTDSLSYAPLGSSLRLLYPNLGVSMTFPLSPRTNLDLGLHSGPVFARTSLERNIRDQISIRESQSGNEYLMYRDDRNTTISGSGTGIGGGIALTLRTKLGRKWGLFLETGGDLISVSRISGSGSSLAGGQTRSWEGDWFMVGETVTKSWERADFLYPSNDPALLGRKTADFHLSFFVYGSLRMGLSLTL